MPNHNTTMPPHHHTLTTSMYKWFENTQHKKSAKRQKKGGLTNLRRVGDMKQLDNIIMDKFFDNKRYVFFDGDQFSQKSDYSTNMIAEFI